ncbi:MAG: FtsH protease activity modulator HflK [Synergistaceae bacterium]|nr:FtsH protease activity modulator HflK [Synergistaceae bacterium]
MSFIPKLPERMPQVPSIKRGNVVFLIILILLGFIGFFVFDSFFMVQTGYKGVVTRFGRITREAEHGLNFKIPLIDNVFKVDTEMVQRIEYGYTTQEVGKKYQDNRADSKMITRDNKIIYVGWIMQFKISNPSEFITNLPLNQRRQYNMIKHVAEAEFREVIAAKSLDEVLTDQRVEAAMEARQNIQSAFDALRMGLYVSTVNLQDVELEAEVQKAFADVETARTERERRIFEAQRYSNVVNAEVEGAVMKIQNEAEAYKFRRVAEANAEVSRVTALSEQYAKNPDLVRINIYAEYMTPILKNVTPIFVEGGEKLNFLDITQLIRDGQTQKERNE